MGVLWLSELRRFSQVASESRKLLDELTTCGFHNWRVVRWVVKIFASCEWVTKNAFFQFIDWRVDKWVAKVFVSRVWVTKSSNTCFSLNGLSRWFLQSLFVHNLDGYFLDFISSWALDGKKSFWIDPYIVEHTHITFKQVQSKKWIRHSLNIRHVCCVSVSNVE